MNKLDLIISMSDFFGAILGTSTEIVVHDIKEKEIVWILNGHITGRKKGDINDRIMLNVLAEHSKDIGDENKLIGYKSKSVKNHELKSSTLFLRDDDGKIEYVICVNQDVSKILYMQDILNSMLGSYTSTKKENNGELNIETITIDLIMEELENSKPFSLDSRESKMTILKRLDEKGVFEVRKAVPKVCEVLQISQASLYKYLQKIKSSE